MASGLETDAARGVAASPSGPNSVVQVATLKSSGSVVVSFVKGQTGRFEDSTVDLPARFTDGEDVITGSPSQGAAAITLSHNFGLYVLTEDGKQILECKSACPYFTHTPFPYTVLLGFGVKKCHSILFGRGVNVPLDSWSNAGPDSFRFQATVV